MRNPLFITDFALQDSFERRARPSALLHVGIIGLATTLLLGAYGLVVGHGRIQEERFRRNPQGSEIWSQKVYGFQFDANYLPAKVAQIRCRLGPDALVGAYPFVEAKTDIECSPKQGGVALGQKGLTLSDKNRLPESLGVSWTGEPFEYGAADQGLIVSPQLLEELGFDSAEPRPTSLTLRVNGHEQSVAISGFTRGPIPFSYLFLIPERQWLRMSRPFVPQPKIKSGPIGANWPTGANDLPFSANARLKRLLIDQFQVTHAETADKKNAWYIACQDGIARGASEWDGNLINIHAALIASGFSESPQFFSDWSPLESRSAPTSLPYVLAMLHIAPRADLEVVAAVAKEAGLPVREQGLSDLKALRDAAWQYQFLALAAGFIVAAVLCLSTICLQYLRLDSKRAEIGLLKVIGLSDGALLCIFLVETLLTVAIGIPIGAVIAVLAGKGLAAMIYPQDDAALGFLLDYKFCILVAAFITAFAMISAWLATRRIRRLPPSMILGEG